MSLGERMKIKLTKNCIAGGGPRKIGETVEVSEREGTYLIAIEKAVLDDGVESKPAKAATKKTSGKRQ